MSISSTKTTKTVLITGCSSGYGLQTALRFFAEGWRVIATMRTPAPDRLPHSDRMRVVALDVTDAQSIHEAVAASGPIDVLVNNAGIGLFGALEATPMASIREVFETNTFGVMAMIRAVLPQLRERRSGTIINVTSSTTLPPMPLVSVYTASKVAVEALTTSLALELAEFGIRVKLVQPGYGPNTNFAANSEARMRDLIPEPYAAFASRVFARYTQRDAVTRAQDVADVVWRAASDTSDQLHFPAGPDAVALAASLRAS